MSRPSFLEWGILLSALMLSTIENAYLNFDEQTKGTLEPGKVADLVVLSEDFLTVPEEQIQAMQVMMTMVGGKIVFSRN